MILVVGATGELGTAICRRLRDNGLSVRGLVRITTDPLKVDYLHNLNVETVRGNLRDRASLDAACQDVETVITTASITMSRQPGDTIQNVDQAGQIDLVEAAKMTGVSRFIYISYSKNLNIDSPLTTAKRAVEQYLIQSRMSYTILRPSFFMEVWFSPMVGFDYLRNKVTIYGSGNNPVSWISRGDVAAFTVAALENPAACNAIVELDGPEALSPLAAVKIFERAAGHSFEVVHVPEAALCAQKAQTTDSVQQSFNALMIDYAKGEVIDTRSVPRLLPLVLMSVEEYATRVLVLAH